MATSTTLQNLTPTNSTSYADIAGLNLGMDRLPGETTAAYVERLRKVAAEDQSHTYEGTMNAIAFTLGLDVQPGIRITGPEGTQVKCDLSGISLVSGAHSLRYPLAVLGEDDVWDWNLLSSMVAAINVSPLWQATLLAPDGPAVLLCRQDNSQIGMPYECVVSGVGFIGLTETSLPALAVTPDGGLAYQMREFLQSIMQVDQSYWPR